MASPVLVTGGTGRLGKLVVARLQDSGRDVRVLARHDRPTPQGVSFFTERYHGVPLRRPAGAARACTAQAEVPLFLADPRIRGCARLGGRRQAKRQR